MLKIALDAMGGDDAPSVVVDGAVKAAKESEGRYSIVLTGPAAKIEAELKRTGYDGDLIEIHDSPQEVAMDESPATVLKTKPESGLVQCVSLQKQGVVQASVSAGNSGAMMAACLMILGRIKGVSRPAIASPLPCQNGQVLYLDLGANVDEKPQNLVDWAICGSVYASQVNKIENPTVGLLNMGEEEKKGPELIQNVHQLLKEAPINFIGNVEPAVAMKGDVDVVVTPGYTGNILLKLVESFYSVHKNIFGDIDTEAGHKFKENWNYDNYGGALLLGIEGTGIIAHGRANADAIAQAVKASFELADNKVAGKISEKLQS